MERDQDIRTPRAAPAHAEQVWSEFVAALDALAPEARAAFLLHAVFEAHYEDIARLLGQPPELCRRQVEAARRLALARLNPSADADEA